MKGKGQPEEDLEDLRKKYHLLGKSVFYNDKRGWP